MAPSIRRPLLSAVGKFLEHGEPEATRPSQAGKQPTLRPSPPPSSSTPSPKKPSSKPGSVEAKHQKRKASRRSPSHRMTTRSKSRAFRFQDLPAELRTNIYRHAFTSTPSQKIDGFTLPPLLAVNKEIRTEGLSIFFHSSEWLVEVRSNWCVRAGHFHGPGFLRFGLTGTISTSHGLVDLPQQEAIRFRNVCFSVSCVCCPGGVELAKVRLRVEAGKADVTEEGARVRNCKEGSGAMDRMMEAVEERVAVIKGRKGFNGFTVPDLTWVGMCFRVDAWEDDNFLL